MGVGSVVTEQFCACNPLSRRHIGGLGWGRIKGKHTEKRRARFFCEDRKQLWLNAEDAELAMNYFQRQLECKGGLVVADNDPGP